MSLLPASTGCQADLLQTGLGSQTLQLGFGTSSGSQVSPNPEQNPLLSRPGPWSLFPPCPSPSACPAFLIQSPPSPPGLRAPPSLPFSCLEGHDEHMATHWPSLAPCQLPLFAADVRRGCLSLFSASPPSSALSPQCTRQSWATLAVMAQPGGH